MCTAANLQVLRVLDTSWSACLNMEWLTCAASGRLAGMATGANGGGGQLRFAIAPKHLDTRRVPFDAAAIWGSDVNHASMLTDNTTLQSNQETPRWEAVRFDLLPPWSRDTNGWSRPVERLLGEPVVHDPLYAPTDEQLNNAIQDGMNGNLYSVSDIYFAEVCWTSEVCRNSHEMFDLEAGEVFTCDADLSRLRHIQEAAHSMLNESTVRGMTTPSTYKVRTTTFPK